MLLDGGTFGNTCVFMKPIQRKDRCTKMCQSCHDQESVDARHERVRGSGNIQKTEWPTLVTATPVTLPPKKYTTYYGGTGGNMIAPVVMQNASTQSSAPWSENHIMYGIANFSDVGGKLDVGALANNRKKGTHGRYHRTRFLPQSYCTLQDGNVGRIQHHLGH